MKKILIVLAVSIALWGCAAEDEEEVYLTEGSNINPVYMGAAPLTYNGTVGGGTCSYYYFDAAMGDHSFEIASGDYIAIVFFTDETFTEATSGTSVSVKYTSGTLTCDLNDGCREGLKICGDNKNGTTFQITMN